MKLVSGLELDASGGKLLSSSSSWATLRLLSGPRTLAAIAVDAVPLRGVVLNVLVDVDIYEEDDLAAGSTTT